MCVKSDDVIQILCINTPLWPIPDVAQHSIFSSLTFVRTSSQIFKMYGSYWLRSVILVLSYLHFAKAHMRMSSPPPIRSPEEGVNVDFDQTSPLGIFPCKGFHTLPGHSSVMNIAA